MFITGLLGWWYGAGWRQKLRHIGERLARAFDAFSIDLLVKTWFAPFRQISAGRVSGPLGVQLRAWGDRMISRMVGGFIRTVVIIVGVLWLLVLLIVGLCEMIVWLVAPLLPVVGAFLMAIGWVPTW